MQIQPVTSEIAEGLGLKGTEGALVAEPQTDSPAAKAGILSGDVITGVNGHAVKDAHDLARQIGSMTPGATAKLIVWRKGEEKSFSLTLGALPKSRDARATTPDSDEAGAGLPKLGLSLASAGEIAGSGTEGVVVTEVDPNGLLRSRDSRAATSFLKLAAPRSQPWRMCVKPSVKPKRMASTPCFCG